jgi:hypothetical protein
MGQGRLFGLWMAIVLLANVLFIAWVMLARDRALAETAAQCSSAGHDGSLCACAMDGVRQSTPLLEADPRFLREGLRPPAELMRGRLQWQLKACAAQPGSP